ncbi:MAG: hypothetical protein CM15mP58_22860 [Burkholderiaceae bacterium]|nr:MAG: hypothetical protein CM15mP58_22860 [Burkholderiaceae bacterium]
MENTQKKTQKAGQVIKYQLNLGLLMVVWRENTVKPGGQYDGES